MNKCTAIKYHTLSLVFSMLALNRLFFRARFSTTLFSTTLFSAMLFVAILFFTALLPTHYAVAQDAVSPLGKWRTIDDETGEPKSIIEFYDVSGGEIQGKIVELLNPSTPNPICDKCRDERANQSITGMVIVWGVKPNDKGNKWGGGKIVDPKNGKIYKVKLSLKERGAKLKVRAYIGAPILGRTQVWERVLD